MIKFKPFKTFIYLTISLIAVFFMLSSALYAESVFLKDGSIVEGKIIKEDDGKIELKLLSGEIRKIERMGILRTLYHNKYKEKKIMVKTDGMKFEVYIVDEDAENYTCRSDLDSPFEMKILKDEVNSVSRLKTNSSVLNKKENGNVLKQIKYSSSGYYLRGIVPGWGQFYSGHYLKGTIFGCTFWGGAAWTVVAILNFNKSKDDYNNLEPYQSQNVYDRAYDKYQKDGKIAKYSAIGLGVFYCVNWIDIIFFSKPETSETAKMFEYNNVCIDLNTTIATENYSKDLRTDLSFTMKF